MRVVDIEGSNVIAWDFDGDVVIVNDWSQYFGVDITAIVSGGESPDLAATVSQQYESGKASTIREVIELLWSEEDTITDLSQPFTVEYLDQARRTRNIG